MKQLSRLIMLTLFMLTGCSATGGGYPMLAQGPIDAPNISVSQAKQVALLVPTSGSLGASGRAIRNGFMAGYYDQNGARHGQVVKVYNTASGDIKSLYKQAVHDGADLVVGPLTKPNVQRLSRSSHLPVPVVALNYSTGNTPDNMIQYALSPQDEAQQVALKAARDGRHSALVIAPNSAWGQGIAKTFEQTFKAQGNQIVGELNYDNGTNLNSGIANLLQVQQSDKRTQDISRLVGGDVQSVPARRQDADMIFLVANPGKAREIRPLLKFYYAKDLPLYATSQIYTGSVNPMRDRDLNGSKFCDTPWVLNANSNVSRAKQQMQSIQGNSNPQLSRLYAFGFDAYTISQQVSHFSANPRTQISGLTGRLYLGPNHHIRRQLSWAEFQNGSPRLIRG